MPLATLRFRLPDEQGDFDAARLGREALRVLWEIDQHCRAVRKYGEPSPEVEALADQVRALIPAELLEVLG